jgi:iron(III) transport system permease protein
MKRFPWARVLVVAVTATAILLPLGIIVYQSLLDGPFFMAASRRSLDAFRFVFSDPDFSRALGTTAALAAGMTAIAVPLGSVLAFLMIRTDLPGRGWLEPLLLVPIFVSPVVLALGYIVAVGPVGFITIWAKPLLGEAPWNLYSLASIITIAGLTHIPHVYLYASSALRSVGPDLEEAARTAGAGPLRVALDVSLPLVRPAILYGGVLILFLGFELFGLPLVLGDPEGRLVLATYLFKLTNKLGIPSYHLMAVVAVVIVAISFPLVWLQRRLLGQANRFVTMSGKGMSDRPLPLGPWRWPAFGLLAAWLLAAVILPLVGITLRSFVSTWGEGVQLTEVLTLEHFREVFDDGRVMRAIFNSVAIAVVGGGLAVAVYTVIGLTAHRWQSRLTRVLDYLVMVPRGMPGLIAGLAFFWVFLFVKPLRPLGGTLFSVWLAYTVVWFAYGNRIVSSALMQVGPELEEAAFTMGATRGQVTRHVTLPLIRFGLVGAWLLIFSIFIREYSIGVYLYGPDTEVIGSLIVSLWGAGSMDVVAALSVINVALVAAGLGVALRLGVRLHG